MTVTRVQHSRITGTGVVPVAGDLAVGELLINLTDASLFSKDGSTVISLIPKGLIVEWYGNAAQVPTGWTLCDGTGGAPDLRDTTSYAAAIDADVGDTGGALSATTDDPGDHNHGSTGGTAINVADMPAHTHKLLANETGSDTTPSLGTSDQIRKGNESGDNRKYVLSGTGTAATQGDSGSAGSNSTHSHTTSSGGAHTHDVSTLSPYHRLYKIMKL